MKERRKVSLISIIVLLTTIFMAAGLVYAVKDDKSAGEAKQKTIGISEYDSTYQFFVVLTGGSKDKAAENNIATNVQDAQIDAAKQVGILENFITQGVDGIIVSTVDGEALSEVAKKAHEAGIPIVSLFVPIDEDYVLSNVVVDEYKYGHTIGKMAGEWAQKNFPGEEIEAAILSMHDYKPGIERRRGEREGFLEYFPTGKVIADEHSNTTVMAMEKTETLLQAHPDVRIFICDSDDTGALGAAEVLNAAIPKDEHYKYSVWGADAVPEALKQIKTGGVYRGTVDVAPYNIGAMAVEQIMKAWNGEAVKKTIFVEFIEVGYDTAVEKY